MAKPEGEPQRPADATPRARGVDPLAVATLAGVVAVLVVSFASWRDIDRIDRKLRELEGRLDHTGTRAPAAHRGPDPDRVYPIRTDASPYRGSASAPVTIAEFSDFQ